tara:strand:- start:1454 stop:2092 length:639 start_codon:yes stop_codon:yes gene_type:complete
MSSFYRYQDSGLDDWNKEDNFVQMGFRPGFAIQARELTQMQTVLQNQLNAIAKKAGIVNGTVIDNNVIVTNTSANNWTINFLPGYFWVQPPLRDFGYAVHLNELRKIENLIVDVGQRVGVFLYYVETQVNPNGPEYTPQGGFAGVEIDEDLNDNAQGFTNFSAPGASRYRINITEPAFFVQGEGELPVNAVEIIYFQGGFPYYSADGSPVTY